MPWVDVHMCRRVYKGAAILHRDGVYESRQSAGLPA